MSDEWGPLAALAGSGRASTGSTVVTLAGSFSAHFAEIYGASV